jgi:ferrous-iron efflux pump FieF
VNDGMGPVETNANRPKRGFDPEAARLMRLATYASVGVAGVLIVTKFAAWLATDSVSLLSTLIDSLLDAAASLVNLFAVRHALQPADDEHRFGHGKAEPLAGLVQAAFIVGSALFLMLQAGERVVTPRFIQHASVGYAVMVFSIVMTVALVTFQRYVVKRSGSLAIGADQLHYQSDVLINGSVLVSIFLASEMGFLYADPLFAIAIALYIVVTAWKIGRDALDILMDRELPDDERERIRQVALGISGVQGVHELRTRSSGSHVFIQMHVEIDGDLPLRRAHRIADAVEIQVAAAFPNAEVIVHQDPDDLEEDHEFQS